MCWRLLPHQGWRRRRVHRVHVLRPRAHRPVVGIDAEERRGEEARGLNVGKQRHGVVDRRSSNEVAYV